MQSSASACPAVREIPGRSLAEEALAAALCGGRRSFWYAAAFLPDHISAILDRGEFDIADRALLSFCQHLIRILPGEARVYRWSGCAVVALLEAHESPEKVRRRLEALPVLGAGQVIPLISSHSLEEVRHEIDFFIVCNL